MNAWKLAASVLLAALYGCSAEHAESVSGNAGFQGETGKPGTALAYEHRVGIRLSAAAQAVADTRQQRERLQREYQTLQQYQGRKDMSVGDLLALAKEIAAVEAQLADNAQAGAQQQRRIATNLLTLSFSSEAQPDSRLGQLATAAGQLLDDLVDGTIAAMKFFAYSLPFLVVLLPLGLLLRGLWRWLRRPGKNEAR